MVGYADDLAMVVMGCRMEEVETSVNEALETVSKWMTIDRLPLAPQNTEALIFNRRRNHNLKSPNLTP